MINQQEKISLSRQCELLNVDRSHLYYQSHKTLDDTELINRINEIYAERPSLGYRKIHIKLREEGFEINKKKIQRIMQFLNIKAIVPGPNTSKPTKTGFQEYPYLLKKICIYKPNQVWAIDITYIRLPAGMVYLFALIDWYSRYIVGWSLANSMCAEHALDAFNKGLMYGIPEICNSDQGSQFTSDEWVTTLNRYNVSISHDGVGRCIDNIRIERFWRTIKYEDINIKHYENMTDLRKGVAAFIDYYNNDRPHQALLYNRPRNVYFGYDLNDRAA